MHDGLALIFGAIVGFSLGLTGGGGGIFAVPLLVYGLSVAPREAVGISLAAVGGIALLGATPKLLRGQVEWRLGLLFAIAGMVGAPLGTYLSRLLPDVVLLTSFSGLMLFVALRMWLHASQSKTADAGALHPENSPHASSLGETFASTVTNPYDPPSSAAGQQAGAAASGGCKPNAAGTRRPTTRCFFVLSALGMGTGILSGMFGVGGGFIIVPALVLFTGMEIHTAVATSLLVIVLVSISGVGSYLIGGGPLSLQLTLLFIVGGILGLQLGNRLGLRLSGPNLQKAFSVAMVLVAIFVVARSLGGGLS